MDVADDALAAGDETVGGGREEGHTDGKDAGQMTGYVVSALVSLVGEQEEADYAEYADEDIAHAGVIVATDGTLEAGPENEYGPEKEQEGQ